MQSIDIHYVDVVFRPVHPAVSVSAMTTEARILTLAATRQEMPVRATPPSAMPARATDRCQPHCRCRPRRRCRP